MKKILCDGELTGVTWRDGGSWGHWPCSILEGDLEHAGRSWPIAIEALGGKRLAVHMPDGLPSKALLEHGAELVTTIAYAKPVKQGSSVSGSSTATALEESATQKTVEQKMVNGKLAEAKQDKPAPTPILAPVADPEPIEGAAGQEVGG